MLSVLMITPEVDKNHDTRGFIHEWVRFLGNKTEELTVVAMRTGTVDLPSNTTVYSLDHKKAG